MACHSRSNPITDLSVCLDACTLRSRRGGCCLAFGCCGVGRVDRLAMVRTSACTSTCSSSSRTVEVELRRRADQDLDVSATSNGREKCSGPRSLYEPSSPCRCTRESEHVCWNANEPGSVEQSYDSRLLRRASPSMDDVTSRATASASSPGVWRSSCTRSGGSGLLPRANVAAHADVHQIARYRKGARCHQKPQVRISELADVLQEVRRTYTHGLRNGEVVLGARSGERVSRAAVSGRSVIPDRVWPSTRSCSR
jgi:hypothetical protein